MSGTLVHDDATGGGETVAEAYEAWAKEHDAVLVYRNEDGEHPLHVYAYLNGQGDFGDEDLGVVVLHQGGDSIHVPYADLGRFVDRLEGLYTLGFHEPSGAEEIDAHHASSLDPAVSWLTLGPDPHLATCARCGRTEVQPDLPLSDGSVRSLPDVRHDQASGLRAWRGGPGEDRGPS